MCHVDAECIKQKKKVNKRSVYQCRCTAGYFGNGIQCASKSTGAVGADPSTIVTVKATLSRDFYDKSSGNFPEPAKTLMKAMEDLNSECNAKFSKCQSNLNVTVKV